MTITPVDRIFLDVRSAVGTVHGILWPTLRTTGTSARASMQHVRLPRGNESFHAVVEFGGCQKVTKLLFWQRIMMKKQVPRSALHVVFTGRRSGLKARRQPLSY